MYETLVIYPKALEALEKYLELTGKRSKHDLKKLARYRQQTKEWQNLPLTPYQIEQLGHYLREKLSQQESYEHSFRWTVTWLENHGYKFPEFVIKSLEDRGAFDDFQVLHNIVPG